MNTEDRPITRSTSIGERFRSYLPEECVRDLWATAGGIAFIQGQRNEVGPWQSYGPAPAGLYRVFIQAIDCRITARYNGRIRHNGFFPAKSIQFVPSDADGRSAGYGPLKFIEVSFSPKFLARHLESLSVNPDVVELRDLPSTADAGLAHLAQTYETVSARGLSVSRLYFDILRQAMFDRIVVRHTSRPIKLGSEMLVPAKLCRVIDYIETNLACDLRLVELSTVAGISRSHFARAFRNTVGVAPHTFVLQRRLARAVECLTLRTLPMREIAARCGFSDQAHLSRAFKSQFGCPPSLMYRTDEEYGC